MQIAGLTLVVVGLAWQRTTEPGDEVSVALHPVVLSGGGGAGVSGAF